MAEVREVGGPVSSGRDELQSGRAGAEAADLRAATSLREKGQLTEALQALVRLVQSSPGHVWAAIELARTQAAAGLYRESAETIGRMVRDNPGHRGAWAAMLGLTAAEARFDLALALVDRALGVFPEDRDFLAERGRYLMRLGDAKAARETLSRLQDTHAGQETAMRFEAQLLLRDDADRAAALLARVFGGQTMAFGKGQFGANRTSGAAVKTRVAGSGGRVWVLLDMLFDDVRLKSLA